MDSIDEVAPTIDNPGNPMTLRKQWAWTAAQAGRKRAAQKRHQDIADKFGQEAERIEHRAEFLRRQELEELRRELEAAQ